jgi:ABC-2 type transport system permease protein
MILFIAVSGLIFLASVIWNAGSTVSVVVLNAETILLWLPVLITMVCMRLFSEERRSGTLETLMTAPVTETQIVLGKYAGAMTFLLLVILPAVSFIFMLSFLSPGIHSIDIGAVYGSCLIIVLISFFCVALGMVVSLFTRNMIVSFFAIFCAVWCVILLGNVVTALPEWMLAPGGDLFSMVVHVDDFAHGSIDTRPIVMYVSGTVCLLFVATRLLESRRWR